MARSVWSRGRDTGDAVRGRMGVYLDYGRTGTRGYAHSPLELAAQGLGRDALICDDF